MAADRTERPTPEPGERDELLACPFCDGPTHQFESADMQLVRHEGRPHCPVASYAITLEQWQFRTRASQREAPAVEDEPVAWLHTLHMEGGQTYTRLLDHDGLDEDEPKRTAFGIPGRDHSEEYPVTSEPLFLRPSPAPVAGEVERMREALNKAIQWFDEYAFEHGCKATQTADSGEQASRLDKARRNKERAAELRTALADGGENVG